MGESFNVNASDTEGYDSDIRNENMLKQLTPPKNRRVDYSKVSFFDGKGEVAPELDPEFANILHQNWWELDKYSADSRGKLNELNNSTFPAPANCSFDPPKIN